FHPSASSSSARSATSSEVETMSAGARLRRLLHLRPTLPDRYRELIARHVAGRTFIDVGGMSDVHGAYAFHALDPRAGPAPDGRLPAVPRPACAPGAELSKRRP